MLWGWPPPRGMTAYALNLFPGQPASISIQRDGEALAVTGLAVLVEKDRILLAVPSSVGAKTGVAVGAPGGVTGEGVGCDVGRGDGDGVGCGDGRVLGAGVGRSVGSGAVAKGFAAHSAWLDAQRPSFIL